ncbi:MAG: hypothetical protein QF569_28365, partial [Candidatus Poribacteria bacterium]|nr:hypothetical protein [Candidatus Poribacteria bacterium]
MRVGDTYQFEVVGRDVNGLEVDVSNEEVLWEVESLESNRNGFLSDDIPAGWRHYDGGHIN